MSQAEKWGIMWVNPLQFPTVFFQPTIEPGSKGLQIHPAELGTLRASRKKYLGWVTKSWLDVFRCVKDDTTRALGHYL
jgi:hypothetical protein